MTDMKLLDARKKLGASPHLTDEEFKARLSPKNDESNIDNLKFDEKDYDILDHIVIDPGL